MDKGDKVKTPRFLTVRINAVFPDIQTARKNGYTEPTYYHANGYGVMGKHTGESRMIFAGYIDTENKG